MYHDVRGRDGSSHIPRKVRWVLCRKSLCKNAFSSRLGGRPNQMCSCSWESPWICSYVTCAFLLIGNFTVALLPKDQGETFYEPGRFLVFLSWHILLCTFHPRFLFVMVFVHFTNSGSMKWPRMIYRSNDESSSPPLRHLPHAHRHV